MKAARHFAQFAGGVAAAACFFCYPNVIGEHGGLARQSAPRTVEKTFPVARQARSAASRRRAPLTAETRTAARLAKAPSVATSRASSSSVPTVSPAASSTASVQAPKPATITLTPLGFVRKPDGTTQAVLGEGEHVQVVSEGEVFADKYKVLKISPTSVELAEIAGVSKTLTAGLSPDTQNIQVTEAQPQIASVKVPEAASESLPGASARTADSPSSASKPLGYVEKANGEVVAVLADGEHVQLVKQEPIIAKNAKPSQQVIAERKPSGAEEVNPKAEPGGMRAAAVMAPPNTPTVAPAVIQAAVLQRVSKLLNPRSPDLEPVNYIPAFLPSSATAPGSVAVPQSASANHPPRIPAENVAHADAKPVTLNTIGYVQKANGQIAAIVDHEDEVYVVHQGEVFADKFKALQVSPLAVVAQSLSPPAQDEPQVPDLLAMTNDPPGPGTVGQTPRPPSVSKSAARAVSRRLRAQGPGPSAKIGSGGVITLPKRAPPVRSKVAMARDAPRPANRSQATTVVRSVSAAPVVSIWKPLGYVQRADGEYEAIVANGDSVYLVHKGEVFAEKFKVIDMSASAVEVMELSPDQLVPQVQEGANWAATEQLPSPQNCILSKYPPLDGTEMGERSPRMPAGGGCVPQGAGKLLSERGMGKAGLNSPSPMPDNVGVPR